ncbi:MAG: DNA polymerase Y family protein [Rhodocyclaceae bacterium]|nr:DNA polymerase Y family protein [Rhodocyclaceae bacterium]
MLWLAISLPDFPLQVLARGLAAPDPFAVAENRRILAANPAARTAGVRPGMGLAGALAIAPRLITRPRSLPQEAAAQRELAACCAAFTPQLSLDGSDGLVLEISASLRLFGGLTALTERSAAALAQLGYTAGLAAAPTPLAARWLARARPGAVVRDTDRLADELAALPVAVLDNPPALQALLASIGAERLGDCLRLPRAGLARRGAQAILDQLDRACARRPDPRTWFEAPPVYRAHLELPAACDVADTLLLVVRRLLCGLAGWLAARLGGVERYTLLLEHADRAPTRLIVSLGALSRDEGRFALLAGEHLTRLELPAPVLGLTLAAEGVETLAGVSGDLFGRPVQARAQAGLLVERLAARLGREAVHGLCAWPEHRPELASRSIAPGQAGRAAPARGARPIWLLCAPQRLEGEAEPWLDGPLHLLAGPERIESGWWDETQDERASSPGDTLRDYYVAQAADGRLLWIFRSLLPPCAWHLHGIFA